MTRRGVTLVEVLVVVAIIALLAAMIMPAIQHARMLQEKLGISLKLKSISNSAIQYSTFKGGSLPSILEPKKGWQDGDKLPLMAYIPFLESNVKFNPFGRDFPFLESLNSATDLSLNSVLLQMPAYNSIVHAGYTSFALNAYFHTKSRTRIGSVVPDGIGYTIYAAEHYAYTTSTGSMYNSFSHYPHAWDTSTNQPTFTAYRTSLFADESSLDVVPVTSGNPSVSLPSIPGVSFQHHPEVEAANPGLLQSTLPCGLMVAMLDGSVRCITPSVTPSVFWGAVTTNGSEKVDIHVLFD